MILHTEKYKSISQNIIPALAKSGRWMICIILIVVFNFSASCQTNYSQPNLWFGAAAGANFNFYSGSTQRANEVTVFPSAFHKGFGVGIFGAGFVEYHRPKSNWGFILQEGYDDRRATFHQPGQEFIARITYFTIEPSVRISPLRKKNFYVYGGPRLGLLASSSFTYKRDGFADYPDRSSNPDAKLFISSLRRNPISMQVGAGYDWHVSRITSREKFIIAPFVAYYPTMWRKNIRTIESLYLSTIRAGIAVKGGVGRL